MVVLWVALRVMLWAMRTRRGWLNRCPHMAVFDCTPWLLMACVGSQVHDLVLRSRADLQASTHMSPTASPHPSMCPDWRRCDSPKLYTPWTLP